LSIVEIEILGTLVKQTGTIGQRAELVRTLDRHVFVEPEHRVIFESIRSLLPRGGFSEEQLAVHLNNRGFPDVDLEKYVAAGHANIGTVLQLADRLNRHNQQRTDVISSDGRGN